MQNLRRKLAGRADHQDDPVFAIGLEAVDQIGRRSCKVGGDRHRCLVGANRQGGGQAGQQHQANAKSDHRFIKHHIQVAYNKTKRRAVLKNAAPALCLMKMFA